MNNRITVENTVSVLLLNYLLLQQQIVSGLSVEGLSVSVYAVFHVNIKEFKHLNICEKDMLAYSGGPAVSLHCSVMWLDSSPTHSALFTGLQQHRSCHVLLVLIRLFPAAGLTVHLSDLSLLVQKHSRKGCDEARCWDWYLSVRLDGLTFSRNVFRRSYIQESQYTVIL